MGIRCFKTVGKTGKGDSRLTNLLGQGVNGKHYDLSKLLFRDAKGTLEFFNACLPRSNTY